MKKLQTAIATVIASSVAITFSGEVQKPKERPTRDFMRQKLNYSQGILEGLVLEKFELVTTNATTLRRLDVTNAFVLIGNPFYRQQVTNFQARVDELLSAAKDKDLKAASAAYSRVTQGCVECHADFRHDQFLFHQSQEK